MEGNGTVGNALEGLGGECSVSSVSLELKPRAVRKVNLSLTAPTIEYKVHVKKLNKDMRQKKLNGMKSLRDPEQSQPKVEQLEYGSERL